jgi:hypothetical protein
VRQDVGQVLGADVGSGPLRNLSLAPDRLGVTVIGIARTFWFRYHHVNSSSEGFM